MRSGIGRIRSLHRFLPLLIVAAAWQALAYTPARAEGLLPTFSECVLAAWSLIVHGDLLYQLGVSLLRAVAGLLIAIGGGVAIGLGMAYVAAIRRTIGPIVTMTYSLPKSALIPILFIWMGVGNAADITVAALGAVVPIIVSTYEGVRNLPLQYTRSAQSLGAHRVHIFFTVTLPGILPFIVPAFRIALAFSMVIVISAEMVGSFVGVGQYTYNFGQNGNYPQMWGCIIVTVIAIYAIDQICALGTRYLLRWK
ncbi:Putative aliphatic sulfonates transport permease protein SsuC [Castellaniella defragrans]